MAISGKFVADFASFEAAVAKAEVSLRGFEGDANKVTKSLNAMSNSLNGTKVIQDATLMAQAVDKIGGVSKLTESELQRLGNQAKEAVAKMHALGIGVPENLQKIASAATPVTSSMETMLSTAGKLAGAFGIGFGIGAVVNFGKALIDDAQALDHMSQKTGVSVQGLQRFQVAGDDAGNTVDELTSSIAKMEDKLANSDKSALAALERLKIPFEDIKNLSPENQFIAISDAIRQVQDPAQQVAIAIDLFGKSGAEVLPTLKRGFDDVKGAAVGMSDETVATLKEAGDLWATMTRNFKASAAEGVVAFTHLAQDGFTPTGHALGEMAREAERAHKELSALIAAIPSRGLPGLGPLQVSGGDSPANQRAAAEIEAALAKQKADRTRDAAKAAEEAAKADQEYFDAVVKLTHAITDIEHPMTDQVILMHDLLSVGERVPIGVDEITKAIERLRTELARVEQQGIPAVFTQGTVNWQQIGQHVDMIVPKAHDASKALTELTQAFADLAQISGGSFGGVVQDIGKVIGEINLAQKAFKALNDALATEGAASWAQYASAATSAITIILTAYSILSSYFAKQQAIQEAFTAEWWDDITKLQDRINTLQADFSLPDAQLDELKAKLQIIHDMPHSSPIDLDNIRQANAALAETLTHYEKLASEASSRFGPSQHERDAAVQDAADVLKFMQDAVTTTTNKITGEVTTTAQYTADQIEKAYYAWQKAMADAGNEAAAAWVKAHDAAASGSTAAEKAMNELQSRRDALAKSVENEAPEEVMGVIESQIRGQIDALDAQMEKQRHDLETQANASADAIEDALNDIHPNEIEINYHYRLVGDPLPNPNPIPQGSGGDWLVTKPTLFLAGEAGAERATFTPLGKSSPAGASEIRQPVIIQVVRDDRIETEMLIDNILKDTSGIRRVLARVAA